MPRAAHKYYPEWYNIWSYLDEYFHMIKNKLQNTWHLIYLAAESEIFYECIRDDIKQ